MKTFVTITIGTLLLLNSPSGMSAEGGIVIYTAIDHGGDDIAKAVPFEKAERFPLVTNVTTQDGKTLRITNNQLKEIVYPPDLTRATIVDDRGLDVLRKKSESISALKKRFPRAKEVLEPLANEVDRTIQVLESGNVLNGGRLMSRADYEKQAAASRPKTIDITIEGKAYKAARISSVKDDQVSMMHSGGAASITIEQLTDEQINQLNGTSDRLVIKRPEMNPSAPLAEASAARENASPPTADTATEVPLDQEKAVEPDTESSIERPALRIGPTVSPDDLRALLNACRRDLVTIEKGIHAMADLKTFPRGRYGSMKLDQAKREADIQRARMDAAEDKVKPLILRLQEIQNLPEGELELPAALRNSLSEIANSEESDVDTIFGVTAVRSKIVSVLEELDTIAPEPPEVQQTGQVQPAAVASAGQSHSSAPDKPTHPQSPTSELKGGPFPGEDLSPTPSAGSDTDEIPAARQSRFPMGILIGAIAYLSLLLGSATAITVVLADRKRRGIEGVPGWIWPTAGGVLAVGMVLGLLAIKSGSFDNLSPTGADGFDPESLAKSANRGDAGAQFRMGVACRDGIGGEANPAEAFRWFMLAAEQGHAEAQCEVAMDYLNDEGAVAVNLEEAVIWLKKAEAQDNLKARANLGWCYANGHGTAKDPERATVLIRDAAEQGDLLAMSGMARLYSGEVEGFEPDPEKAFEWYHKLGELGDRAGQFNLGCCYLLGQGTIVNRARGWPWIERSAEQGFEPAVEALQERQEQAAINEMRHRLQQQIERNLQQRPQGANPFSAHPSSQYVPPQFRDAQRRAYEGLREQGYSDEVLRQQGYR